MPQGRYAILNAMDDKPSTKYPFIDPSHAVVLRERLFTEHKLSGAKEDWVIVNARLMEDLGAKVWLNQFLDAVSLPRTKYDGHDIINPYYVVVVSKALSGKPETPMAPTEWIAANEKIVNEVGPAGWLWMLLDVLETGASDNL